jgi:hypothetical protein
MEILRGVPMQGRRRGHPSAGGARKTPLNAKDERLKS